MSGTARKPRERRIMDVKVLYTLSTMPNSTMVARLGRPMPIEISNAPRLKRSHPSNQIPSSPGVGSYAESSRNGMGEGHKEPSPQFGHVTLKACLSAICIASPELVIDRRRDWSLYVTDPKEHYRWTLRQQAAMGRRFRSSNEASNSRGTSVSPSKENRPGSSSASRSTQNAPQNFEAGKGLFSWVLAEPEEGTSTVIGRVVSDAQSQADSDFSDDESDEELEVLEVVLRLSEMPAHSKNDYFETLRAFSSSSSSNANATSTGLTPRPTDTPLASITSAVEARRLRRSMANSSAFGSASATQSSPVKACPAPRVPAHALQSSPVQPRNSGRSFTREESITAIPQPTVAAPAFGDAMIAPSFSNEPLQLLGMLQAYTAQTSTPASAAPVAAAAEGTSSRVAEEPSSANPAGPDLQGFLQALVSTLSGASGTTDGSVSAPAPSISPETASVPLPDAGMAAPEARPAVVAAPTSESPAPTPAPHRAAEGQPAAASDQQPSSRAQTTSQQTRKKAPSKSAPPIAPREIKSAHPIPTASSPILGGLTPGYESDMSHASPHPRAASLAAATPGPTSEAGAPGSAEAGPVRQCYNCGITGNKTWRYVIPAEGRAVVRFVQGSETTGIRDAKCTVQYRACNACAQYFMHKKGKAHRPEEVWKKAIARKRAGRSTSAAGKRKAATGDHDDEAGRTPATATEGGSPTEVDELSEYDDGEGGSHKPLNSRSGPFARTLSAVVERDRKRIKLEAASKSKPVIVERYEDARLKDFLIDSTGRLRTKRAIKDNPDGRKPGRPKGSKASRSRARKGGRADGEAHSRTSPVPARTSPLPSMTSPATARTSPAQSLPAPTPAGAAAARSSPPPLSSATQAANHATGVRPILGATPVKGRYGAPDHLLQSSPGTALGMLLSEGDTDWNQIGPGYTPVRRSPRKQPHGTRSGLNPYASTVAGGQGSPSLDRSTWAMPPPGAEGDGADHGAAPTNDAAATALDELMAIHGTSPITRGRLRSLRFDANAHPALFTSSDEAEGSRAARGSASAARHSYSSCQTSPGSPTPSSASRRANAKFGRAAMSDSLASMRSQPLGAPMLSAGLASKLRGPRSPSAERKSARQARSKAAAALVDDLGPFMGTIGTSPLGVDDDDDAGGDEQDGEEGSVGHGSPTLGAARRRRQTKRKASAELGRITSHSPSDLFEFLNQDALSGSKSSGPVTHEWERAENVPDFFNSPASTKGGASTTGKAVAGTQSLARTPQAGGDAAPPPTTADASVTTTIARVPRRPLPATVEDASSSSASSSPQDEISPSSAGETPMSGMEVFEDPYGLLAMHGFGPNANGQITADTVPQRIQTFAKGAFGAHLEQFTQEGATGVAAKIVGDGTGFRGGDVTLEIAGGSTSALAAVRAPPQSPRRSQLGASPSKMLALQATPTRMRTRSQASTPLKSPDYLSAFLNALATTPNKGKSPSKDRPNANANFSPTTAALLANFDLLPNPFLAPPGSSEGGGGASGKGLAGVNIDHATARELFPGAFGSPTSASPSKGKRRRLALESGEEEVSKDGGTSSSGSGSNLA